MTMRSWRPGQSFGKTEICLEATTFQELNRRKEDAKEYLAERAKRSRPESIGEVASLFAGVSAVQPTSSLEQRLRHQLLALCVAHEALRRLVPESVAEAIERRADDESTLYKLLAAGLELPPLELPPSTFTSRTQKTPTEAPPVAEEPTLSWRDRPPML